MKIHDVKQGEEEWLALRRQYFTGSALGDWLVEQPKLDLTISEMTAFLSDLGTLAPKGAKWADLAAMMPDDVREKYTVYTGTRNKAWRNAIWDKLGELSQDDEPDKPTWAMERGTELEPLARQAYEQHTGFMVREVGFISHDCDGFGVSPDGLVMGEDETAGGDVVDAWSHGLELKCPVARTMLKWLDAGTLPDEHKLQVHASMAASGLSRWDFFAWHPELVPMHLIVERDEFTEQVLSGLLKLSDDYSAAKAKLAKWIATPTAETP
jgi:hypothetical protein